MNARNIIEMHKQIDIVINNAGLPKIYFWKVDEVNEDPTGSLAWIYC